MVNEVIYTGLTRAGDRLIVVGQIMSFGESREGSNRGRKMIEVNPTIFLTYRARDIQTSMSSNPICIDINDSSTLAVSKLDAYDFEQAPVVSDNVVIGWVLKEELRNNLRFPLEFHRLSQSDLVSADTPVNYLFQKLVEQQLIFLVGGSGIEGFVVRSDIDRHVSRSHLYLLVSGLQIVLTRIIERDYLYKETLIDTMTEASRQAFLQAKRKGFDANPVEYLSIQKACEVCSQIDGFLEFIGMSLNKWNKYSFLVKNIRNWVAHNNRVNLPPKIDFPGIVNCMSTTEKIIKQLENY